MHIIHTGIRDESNQYAMKRVAARTGGSMHAAEKWPKQAAVLAAIREHIAKSYVLTYRPSDNKNQGFRRIEIVLKSDPSKRLRIAARPGYHARMLEQWARHQERASSIVHR